MKTVQEAVGEQIAKAGTKVFDGVVETIAGAEIRKRQDAIVQAVAMQDKLDKEFQKINKPDNVTYVEGTRVEVMTEKRFNEIKKLKERMEKLTTAINKCLELNTQDEYNKLGKLISGKPDEPKTEGSAEGGGKEERDH